MVPHNRQIDTNQLGVISLQRLVLGHYFVLGTFAPVNHYVRVTEWFWRMYPMPFLVLIGENSQIACEALHTLPGCRSHIVYYGGL